MKYIMVLVWMVLAGTVMEGRAAEQQSRWSRGWPVTLPNAVLSNGLRITHLEKSQQRKVREMSVGQDKILEWRGRLGAGKLQIAQGLSATVPSAEWLQPQTALTDRILKQVRQRLDGAFLYGAKVTLKQGANGGVNIGVTAANKGALQLATQHARRILREERTKASRDKFLIPLPVFHGNLKPGDQLRSNQYYDMDELSAHYADWLSDVTTDLAADAGPGHVSARLLDFLQSIPYRELGVEENAGGLFSPDQMLARLEGDCDSKSLFWLGAMRKRFPGLPLVFVVTHNHAFVGRALLPGERVAGTVLPIGQNRFLLSEPVGPGLFPEGVIGANSLAALKKGIWHHQVINP